MGVPTRWSLSQKLNFCTKHDWLAVGKAKETWMQYICMKIESLGK
jgi:hypothetical protein